MDDDVSVVMTKLTFRRSQKEVAEVTQRCESLLHLAQLVRYKITVLTTLVMGSMILLGWLLQ